MTAPQAVLRRFTTRFHPRNRELLVYGSFLVGAFVGILSFASGNLIYFTVSTVFLATSFYYHPFLDTDNAQVGADTRGLYIRKLGYIPWAAVEAFRVHRVAVRTVEKARLQIKLVEDWREKIQCETNVPLTERYSFKIWRKRPGNIIEVRLEYMKESSRVIEASIKEIWQNRPVSSKELDE